MRALQQIYAEIDELENQAIVNENHLTSTAKERIPGFFIKSLLLAAGCCLWPPSDSFFAQETWLDFRLTGSEIFCNFAFY